MIIFQYWLVILSLLEKGIPYDTILTFSDNELRTVLAVKQALDERKQEEIDKQHRIQQAKSRMQ